eukprot:763225-Hanusia_phi.AAC.1
MLRRALGPVMLRVSRLKAICVSGNSERGALTLLLCSMWRSGSLGKMSIFSFRCSSPILANLLPAIFGEMKQEEGLMEELVADHEKGQSCCQWWCKARCWRL